MRCGLSTNLINYKCSLLSSTSSEVFNSVSSEFIMVDILGFNFHLWQFFYIVYLTGRFCELRRHGTSVQALRESLVYNRSLAGWGKFSCLLIWFLAHLSWKLKWAFLIVRRLSVCLLNIYIFNFFFRTAGPILTRLGTKHPWAKGIQNCTDEGQPPSPRGDNSERVKIHWKLLKIVFSRTSRTISIKLDTNHP
jgi:hypothetical protein